MCNAYMVAIIELHDHGLQVVISNSIRVHASGFVSRTHLAYPIDQVVYTLSVIARQDTVHSPRLPLWKPAGVVVGYQRS